MVGKTGDLFNDFVLFCFYVINLMNLKSFMNFY